MAQEEAIREYRDSLVKAPDDHDIGSSAALTEKATAAVKAVKTGLRTEFDRMLAVADPRNGENFILEVLSATLILCRNHREPSFKIHMTNSF